MYSWVLSEQIWSFVSYSGKRNYMIVGQLPSHGSDCLMRKFFSIFYWEVPIVILFTLVVARIESLWWFESCGSCVCTYEISTGPLRVGGLHVCYMYGPFACWSVVCVKFIWGHCRRFTVTNGSIGSIWFGIICYARDRKGQVAVSKEIL